jgi:hypothetical protein
MDVLKNFKKSLKRPLKIKEITEYERSDISFASFSPAIKPQESKPIVFNATADNPNGINLGLDQTYIPKISKESQFSIDTDKLSYKTVGQLEKENNNETIRKFYDEAINKFTKLKKIKKIENKENEEEEDEEEEESYTSGSSESEKDSNEDISSIIISKNDDELVEENTKKENKKVRQSVKMMNDKNLENINKEKNDKLNGMLKHNERNDGLEDYYHVKTDKITFSVYNFSTKFVEVIKDPKYKVSQIVKSINAEKEKLKLMNSKFLAGVKIKEKKKGAGPVAKKAIMDDDELNAYSEKKIKLREIQKALASKEKQQTIINLCIISFIVFILIIGSSITSIFMNIYLSNKTLIYYNLIEKSVTLYRNLIFEINFVRELILLANPIYTNIYDTNEKKELYYQNFSAACY